MLSLAIGAAGLGMDLFYHCHPTVVAVEVVQQMHLGPTAVAEDLAVPAERTIDWKIGLVVDSRGLHRKIVAGEAWVICYDMDLPGEHMNCCPTAWRKETRIRHYHHCDSRLRRSLVIVSSAKHCSKG